MRVIYLVRAAQLLVTLRALWLLYSVGAFCERTQHTMKACSDMIARIPFATPEQIAEFERAKKLRPASNRRLDLSKTTTTVHPTTTTTTTAHAPASIQSSTVPLKTSSSKEEVLKRQKRDERRELPGNGMTEAQRKAASVETKKVEKEVEKKVDEKKIEEAKKEEKKEEVKETTPEPSHETKEDKKDKPEEKKEEQKPAHNVTKKPDEKKDKPEEKKEEQKPTHAETKKPEEKKVETTTEAVKNEQKEVKEHLGAKVEIPVAPETLKAEKRHDEKKADGKAAREEQHHTVKKDLKAHVQEPVKAKKAPTTVPKLAPAQKSYVLEHSDAFLQEVRCLEVTSDDYFGKQASPFAEHLKGLAFCGPVLVVVAIYLVCTVLRTRLSHHEAPAEFTDTLGVAFHCGMWVVVALSMLFLANHWSDNWHNVSANTFAPEFPCAWTSLMVLAVFMAVATVVEAWFHKRLYYDIVFERSYRCYEVIDNSDAAPNQGHFSRTNVY